VYLVVLGGLPIVIIGLASIASGIAYTGGPYPLGYHGLGDIFVLVFFGPVAVCGTTYVAAGRFDAVSVVASIGAGALATGVLVVNNVRDVETDVKTNKRTLPVRFGRGFGVAEYAGLLLAAESVPIVLVFGFGVHLAALAALLTLPIAVKLIITLHRHREGDILNRTLANTAKLLLVHGVLLAVGISLSRA
jgi:1,4-dihydroxy-2-naphthoate octaprenyltransferase